jgi:tetraacyldisaccharide 4'-kinase
MRLSQRLQQAWWRTDGHKDWLSIALLDLSWLYGAVVRLRRKLYASGVMHSTRVKIPVIIVGNVIAGGAGKTPVVIEITRYLQSLGYRPGIVSRGYGRRSKDLIEVRADTSVTNSGDEPALIHAATGAPVFVAADRAEAATALLATHAEVNVILSDDGLQHLALQRDIEIIVFDERGIGNGRLLPAGPLREPWPRQSDFVLHRGGFKQGDEISRQLAEHAIRPDGTQVSLQSLIHQPVQALAGIAQPEAFFSMLRDKGLHIANALALPDHYDFNSKLSNILPDQPLICTEKDAIKLWRLPSFREQEILAVPLQVQLPSAFTQALQAKLSSLHGHQTT